MLAQFLHKTFSIGLAILLLVTTTSFTVQKRYCHDDLIGVSVFSHMDDCKGEEFIIRSNHVESVKCCTDKIEVFQGQDTLKNVTEEGNSASVQVLFLTAFSYTYIDLLKGLSQNIVPFKHYLPPELSIDRQVLHQVFLI